MEANTNRRDARWRVGFRFWACVAMAPAFLLAITGASMAMQYNVDEAGNKIGGPSPRDVYRLRFGPNAYWRLVDELVSEWRVIGLVSVPGDTIVIDENVPIQSLTFGSDNEVTVTRRDGTVEEGMHRWWPAGAWLQIRWFWLVENHPDRAESDLVFKDRRLYFAWPVTPDRMGEGERRQRGYTGYVYLERVSNSP